MPFLTLQICVFKTLTLLGLLPKNLILPQQLDAKCCVWKKLDEHRELIESIENQTGYFSSNIGYWSKGHAALQDDYLVQIYKLRYQKNPTDDLQVRERPKVYSKD